MTFDWIDVLIFVLAALYSGMRLGEIGERARAERAKEQP